MKTKEVISAEGKSEEKEESEGDEEKEITNPNESGYDSEDERQMRVSER